MKKKMMFFIAIVVVATTFTSCSRYIVDNSMGGCGVWYPKNPEREARREARRSYSNVSPGKNFGW